MPPSDPGVKVTCRTCGRELTGQPSTGGYQVSLHHRPEPDHFGCRTWCNGHLHADHQVVADAN